MSRRLPKKTQGREGSSTRSRGTGRSCWVSMTGGTADISLHTRCEFAVEESREDTPKDLQPLRHVTGSRGKPFIIMGSANCRNSHCKDTLCSTFWEIYDAPTCAERCALRTLERKLCSWVGSTSAAITAASSLSICAIAAELRRSWSMRIEMLRSMKRRKLFGTSM